MEANEIEPLDLAAWLIRISQLSKWKLENARVLEKALRHSFYLVQLVPAQLRHAVTCELTEPEFERLLESSSLRRAASALMCEGAAVKSSEPRFRDGSSADFRHNGDPSGEDDNSDARWLFRWWLYRIIRVSAAGQSQRLGVLESRASAYKPLSAEPLAGGKSVRARPMSRLARAIR